MERPTPVPLSRTALQLLAWCGLVLVLCPSLTTFSRLKFSLMRWSVTRFWGKL